MDTPSETNKNALTAPTATNNESPFIRKIPVNDTVPATLSLRVGAFLVDYILTLLIILAAIVLALICKGILPLLAGWIGTLGYVAAAAFVILNWGFLCLRDGQTIGDRLVGIKIIRADGSPLHYSTILLRHLLGYPVSLLCGGLGFLWMIIDARQRGWHDKIAGTLMIKN